MNSPIGRSRALFFVVVLMAAVGSGCRQSGRDPAGPPPALEVTVTPAIQRDVPVSGEWVATLDGFVNAQIQPYVSGYLIRQNYREGAFVHKDEVLFQIDPRPFQAALDQARGQLAQARGQLAEAEGRLAQSKAQLELAQINVRRDTPLAAAHAIAQSQLDSELQIEKTAEANIVTSRAAIVTAKAAIETAEAAVRTGELNLGFTKVRSLVNGIAGMAAVQIGNLVSPSAVLTTVSQVDPIKVCFPITEQEYLKLTGLSKSERGDGWLKKAASTPLQLVLSDGSIYAHTGRVYFTDRQVDSQTGTIRVVGTFPNPGNMLRPGQFGRVRALKETVHGAVLVPQRAVAEIQGQYQVAVVGTGNRVSLRSVTVGPRAGTLWVIERGLQPGERVVTEGVAKLADGTPVVPKAEAPPSDSGQAKGN
jgi:membrane fusion protein (multidrug efflux system)